MFIVIELQYLH